MKFDIQNQSADSRQEFTIKIPSILAKRAETFARENNTTLMNVVIEALDTFLREQAKK